LSAEERLKATYAIDKASKEPDGKYSRMIIAQIHGRLSDEQRDLIGQKIIMLHQF
jgi:hypothetical protein